MGEEHVRGMEKANPNKRVCAILIDTVVVTIIQILLINALRGILGVVDLLLFTVFVLKDSYQGQSPGKMLVGLKVVDLNGNPISYNASFKRNIIFSWVYLIVLLPASEPATAFLYLGLGVIQLVIAVTEYLKCTYSKDGRRFGDIFAATKVVDLRPERTGWVYLIFSVIVLILWNILQNLFFR